MQRIFYRLSEILTFAFMLSAIVLSQFPHLASAATTSLEATGEELAPVPLKPEQSELPDLVIEDLRVTPENPKLGDHIQIDIRLKNKGEASVSKFQLTRKSSNKNSGVSSGWYRDQVLDSGEYYSKTNNEWFEDAGGFYLNKSLGYEAEQTYTFSIIVDAEGAIKESDETNNVKEVTLTLAPADPQEKVCPTLWNPVCGLDGKTYPNDCGLAKEKIAYPGECIVVQPPDTKLDTIPRVAFWWGKVNRHTENGVWKTDPDGTSGADLDQLLYCKKWYPNTQEVRKYKEEMIPDWRDRGNTQNAWPRNMYDQKVFSYECVPGTPNGGNNNDTCNTNHEPVCGVDGKTYPNDCGLEKEEISYRGKCAAKSPDTKKE